MNRIEETIKGLPEATTCFALEIGKPGAIELTKAIGKLLKKHRPLCVLFSFANYDGIPDQFKKYKRDIKYKHKIDDNVMLFNQTKENFLKNNTTHFNIIFAHNSIDKIPFEKFLTDNGKTLIASTLEVSEVLSSEKN